MRRQRVVRGAVVDGSQVKRVEEVRTHDGSLLPAPKLYLDHEGEAGRTPVTQLEDVTLVAAMATVSRRLFVKGKVVSTDPTFGAGLDPLDEAAGQIVAVDALVEVEDTRCDLILTLGDGRRGIVTVGNDPKEARYIVAVWLALDDATPLDWRGGSIISRPDGENA